jgi:hypothetical protein
MVLPGEPYAEAELRKICRAALEHGTLRVTQHAKDPMAEEGLTMNDVRNTLLGGRLLHFDRGDGGAYKYRMSTAKIDAVVIVTAADSIILVTAFRSTS